MALRHSWLASIGAIFLVASASAQSLRFTRIGTSLGENYGSSVAALADITGDGFDEIIVGAETYFGAQGKVQVIDGRDGNLIWERFGAAVGDRFGSVVAAIGDVDGNGFADVLVGAPRWDNGAALDVGRVYVISGDQGTIIRTIDGPGANARYGSALAAVGDQDGDGVVDFAVGAPQAAGVGSNAGLIEVRSGDDGLFIWSVSGASGNRLGAAVIAADVNGDGFLDVVGGATHVAMNGSQSGRVTAFAHGSGAVLGQMNGAAAGDQFGRVLANMGDLDGDGRDDIAVGTPLADPAGVDSGRVVIVSLQSSTILATLNGTQAGENLGTALASGDIAFDGTFELLIGAPGYSGTHGATSGRLIIAGSNGSVRKEIYGNDAGDQFGNACAYIRRGREGAAFVVGAWRDDNNSTVGSDNGMITVYDFERSAHPFLVEFPNVEFGEYGACATVPDVNGDGRNDVVRTSYFRNALNGTFSAGNAELVDGATGERIWRRSGDPLLGLGSNVTSLGDQNQDGVADIAVAAATGSVKILSGLNGADLGMTTDPAGEGFYGVAMTVLDDMDDDGIPEFLITRAATSVLGPAGRLDFHHGGDFALMNSVAMPNAPIGAFCELFVDKDGDGKRDLLVGAELVVGSGGLGQPRAFVVSSATGAVIATFDFGSPVSTGFPYTVPNHSFVVLGDIDADGVDDFAVIQASAFRIYSGATYLPTSSTNELGRVTAAGDVNGDGHADYYLCYATGATATSITATRVRLISGSDLSELSSKDVDFNSSPLRIVPQSIRTSGDLDGDGFGDILFYDQSGNVSPFYVSPRSGVASLVGGARFGDTLDRPHQLSLDWSPNVGGTPVTGSIVAAGSGGFATGIIAVSAERERSVFAAEVIVLPVDSARTLAYAFGFDATGAAQFAANLREPVLAGQTLHIQVFGLDASAPFGLVSSNGLSVSFVN